MTRKGAANLRSVSGPVNTSQQCEAKYYLGTTLANGELVDLYVGDCGTKVFAKYTDGEEVSAPIKDVDGSTAELYVAKFLIETNRDGIKQWQRKQKRRLARR